MPASNDPSEPADPAGRGHDQLEAALCERFAPLLRRHVARRMGPRVRRWVEPEDIVQRTLLEVLPKLPRPLSGAEDDEVLRRLQRTANNRMADVARKHDRDAGESAHEGRPAQVQQVPTAGPVTLADSHRWLQALVQRLPDGYREVVQRCALQGMTFVECAQDLELEPDAVRKRYHKARELLASKISARRNG